MESRNLATILSDMGAMDEALTGEIDPEALVGELRGKVDALKEVMDRLEAHAEIFQSKADRFAAAAGALKRNAKRLKEYVTSQMVQHSFDMLPGDDWRIKLQENAPKVDYLRSPTPNDYKEWPQYTEMKFTYLWKTEEIKRDLANGIQLPFASISRGKHARFYLNSSPKKATSRTSKTKKELTNAADETPDTAKTPANKGARSLAEKGDPDSVAAPHEPRSLHARSFHGDFEESRSWFV